MKKNPQENQEVTNPSHKDRYRNRYREMHPDLDPENEEAFYETANGNLDELESYRKHNNDLIGTFSKNKAFASMLMAAKNGEDPYEWMAANLGADISELPRRFPKRHESSTMHRRREKRLARSTKQTYRTPWQNCKKSIRKQDGTTKSATTSHQRCTTSSTKA